MSEGLSSRRKACSIVWQRLEVDPDWKVDNTIWKIKTRYKRAQGDLVYYYCKSPDCISKMKVEYGFDQLITGVYTFDLPHSLACSNRFQDHNSSIESESRNNDITKQKIIEIYQNGITQPRNIKIALTASNIGINVDSKRISTIISRYRKKTLIENNEFATSDLETLCNQYLFRSDTEPFIVNYHMSPIKILITTYECIKQIAVSDNLHLDATYRLTIYGFPVIVVGISDLNRKFHCSAIVLCQKEDKDTYLWILIEIRSFLRSRGLEFKPKNIIADNSAQISAAIREFDPELLRTNCWAHISRLIKPKLERVRSLELRNTIKNDIWFLQSLTSRELFNQGLLLFQIKYQQFGITRQFINSFFIDFVEKNQNWGESYDVFAPSTNNSLERFNRTIKDKYTFWNRKGIIEFLEASIKIMKDYSMLIPSLEKINYSSKEVIELDVNFEQICEIHNTRYYLVANNEENRTQAILNIQTKFHRENETFDEFYSFYSSFTFITVKTTIASYEDIICSCFYFAKCKKCMHVYSYLKKEGLIRLIEINLLNLKKKRGRPKKIRANTSLVQENMTIG